MSALLKRIRAWISGEPAVTAWFINGGLALLAAYALGLSKTDEAALATIVSGLATLWTALQARKSGIPLALGSLTTILTAAGAFGLHLSADATAMATTVASIVLALLFRQNLTPVSALRKKQAAAGMVTARIGAKGKPDELEMILDWLADELIVPFLGNGERM